MKACDRCKSSDQEQSVAPITVTILRPGGTLYQGRADLCDDCISELADSIGTPAMARIHPSEFTAPVAKPATS